ncbi:hypothetical protein BP6252_05620 [Coleophoma cylindrospora]|uniref:DUF7580 domain-containing protein n=1 Tax=Coleophoma cylindrospora TaxID=1849047 RepID=A0A3D8RU02_9HELO|nr:hypothetical protein BP6252_05620 [Coleophoma cylindrospora]
MRNTNGTQSLIASHSIKPKKSVRLEGWPESQNHEYTLYKAPIETLDTTRETEKVPMIEDLCSTLCADVAASRFGYLLDEENRKHKLQILKTWPESLDSEQFTHGASKCQLISLEKLLDGQSRFRMSRQDRYKIANVLASSLLQLQTTPWIANQLEKQNIMFYHNEGKVFLEHPYIRHDFSSVGLCPKSQSTDPRDRFIVRNSLNGLGILLLELCFGQSIETQEVWKEHLGSDGHAHPGTRYLAARDWAELVYGEDPALQHIIKRCVLCLFEEKADWGSKKFVQAVYASIVSPLDKIVKKWPE